MWCGSWNITIQLSLQLSLRELDYIYTVVDQHCVFVALQFLLYTCICGHVDLVVIFCFSKLVCLPYDNHVHYDLFRGRGISPWLRFTVDRDNY